MLDAFRTETLAEVAIDIARAPEGLALVKLPLAKAAGEFDQRREAFNICGTETERLKLDGISRRKLVQIAAIGCCAVTKRVRRWPEKFR
jgi:hypothetical protein